MTDQDALRSLLNQSRPTVAPRGVEPPELPPQPPKRQKSEPSADGLVKYTMRLDENVMDQCWGLCEQEGIPREVLIEAILLQFLGNKSQGKVFAIARQINQSRQAAAAKRKAAKRRKK